MTTTNNYEQHLGKTFTAVVLVKLYSGTNKDGDPSTGLLLDPIAGKFPMTHRIFFTNDKGKNILDDYKLEVGKYYIVDHMTRTSKDGYINTEIKLPEVADIPTDDKGNLKLRAFIASCGYGVAEDLCIPNQVETVAATNTVAPTDNVAEEDDDYGKDEDTKLKKLEDEVPAVIGG